MKPRSVNGNSQSISYTWYHLQSCPDRPGVYCLSASPTFYQFTWADASGPVTSSKYQWKQQDGYELGPLIAFLYSLYVPPANHFLKDPTITLRRDDQDGPPFAFTQGVPPSWDIHCGDRVYENCKILSVAHPWGRRTTVFEHERDGKKTIIKEYYRDGRRRFKEEDLLNQIHSKGTMPGVIRHVFCEEVMTGDDTITTARDEVALTSGRVEHQTKVRLVFPTVGQHLSQVSSLKELLMVFFDLVEVHRAILNTGIMHRDISLNNILFRPTHAFNSGDEASPIVCNPEPKFICDVDKSFNLEPSRHPRARATCLLIDFDNAARTEVSGLEGKELVHRTGTPMYIARAVSRGEMLGKYSWHKKFTAMPELTNRARELYNDTWGKEVYEMYSDLPDTCHGCKVPEEAALSAIHQRAINNSYRHRPDHDVESMGWSLLILCMQAVPKGPANGEAVKPEFRDACKTMKDHTIGKQHVDRRDQLLSNIALEENYRKDLIHPDLLIAPFDKLLQRLALHMMPEYGLLEGIRHDHLHEVWRRLLLCCLVEMGDENLDVELDPKKMRKMEELANSKSLKRGRDGGDGASKRRRPVNLERGRDGGDDDTQDAKRSRVSGQASTIGSESGYMSSAGLLDWRFLTVSLRNSIRPTARMLDARSCEEIGTLTESRAHHAPALAPTTSDREGIQLKQDALQTVTRPATTNGLADPQEATRVPSSSASDEQESEGDNLPHMVQLAHPNASSVSQPPHDSQTLKLPDSAAKASLRDRPSTLITAF
ncbi:hypothetical protein NM688_g4196 [Phlebia brevispora]|uniref:Uncharacterized protein n=1 Tax=Phlebia brevispora TaxID=194682 RepID=A0ACC1T3S9_9APHY|nr:hypothetical protein NM688_g4196 [Phlebia brevispora]